MKLPDAAPVTNATPGKSVLEAMAQKFAAC